MNKDKILSIIFYIISVVFHPLLLVTITVSILLHSQNYAVSVPTNSKLAIIFVFFLLTFLVPFLSILIFYWAGSIDNWQLDKKEDRFLPFLLTTIFYIISAYFFTYKIPIAILPHITTLLWTTSVCLGLVTWITYFWQISAHGVGIGGILGFFVGLQVMTNSQDWSFWIQMFVFFVGLVMTARLYLQAHTPLQVWSGVLLGLVVCGSGQILFF